MKENEMEEKQEAGPERTAGAVPDGVDGLEYPVEFELRVIHLIEAGSALADQLAKVLAERGASLESPRALPASGVKYGRLACKVRFENKETLYATYAAIGELPGIKAVL
jgi:putative lipoic acid-binding regulatory protein